jgi:hypothetical protein
MAQATECLTSKCKALSLNSTVAKKKKKEDIWYFSLYFIKVNSPVLKLAFLTPYIEYPSMSEYKL